MNDHTYDAIVVGAGMTGGWAAKELTEKGLTTLVLERGRDVKHGDYPTSNMAPWEFDHGGYVTRKEREEYYIQSLKYNFDASSKDFYVKDIDHPYRHPEDKPFRWFRGYQTGGRSMLWGRGAYRFSDIEFGVYEQDGVGIDWPIRYKDLDPWYTYVERFIGVAGSIEGIPQFPDGDFLPPFDMNIGEQVVKRRLEAHYPDRKLIPNRVAHITEARAGRFKGRSVCQTRNLCHRGCPYGAYFTSNNSTLPAAYDTGKMTLKNHAIVHSVIYDEKNDRVAGVHVIDAQTNETTEYFAKVIFLCASTIASTALLLRSVSSRFDTGLANSSGVLGHYLMDTHKNVGGYGTLEGYENVAYRGFRPASMAVPRFRNVFKQDMDFLRGYGFWGSAYRTGINSNRVGIGSSFKSALTRYGPWKFGLYSQGASLPYYDNKISLDSEATDQWGLPIINISAAFKDNEMLMRKDMEEQALEILEVMGLRDISVHSGSHIMGDNTHELGTARMGRDPKTSVLNAFNQCHDVPNLFVTDGSCMVSSGHMSPSLTYMALTARACDFAVRQMKRGLI